LDFTSGLWAAADQEPTKN